MSSAFGDLRAGAAHRWLAVVLLLSLCINLVGIGWGLPNAKGTWAADSLPPTAPMAIAKHVFGGDPPNSGWFYFKYPLGHPLVVLAAQAPYLAWLRLTGQFESPTSTYPYGFRDPDRALLVLALLMRVVSALMGVGVVALTYVITTTLFGTLAGLVAAALVSGCYPLVFFAHTANVDVAMLFWVALAVAATLKCAEDDSTVMAAVAGASVAMALLTKEQSIGALAMVPAAWILQRRSGPEPKWGGVVRHAAVAGACFLTVTFLVGNIWWNPAGYMNRWRFLLGTLPAEVREKYAPYQILTQVPKGVSLARELERLRKVTAAATHGLTFPVVVLSFVGAVWALWRRPYGAVTALLLIAGYYVVSLRAVALVPVRYTMPLIYFLLVLAGAGGAVIMRACRQRLSYLGGGGLAVVLVVAWACALLPGIEIDRLLVKDPRYAAEAWLRAYASPGERVEVYQSRTYLPRFRDDLQVTQVPIEQRTVDLFRQRRPDFVVLSSGAHPGLIGRYVRNWRPGEPTFAENPAAKEMIEHLENEELGYRRLAYFHTPAGWITPRINSVNPEITVLGPTERAKDVPK